MTRPADIPEWAWDHGIKFAWSVENYLRRTSENYTSHHALKRVADAHARALMEAGPGWNDDMDAAPKNGDEVWAFNGTQQRMRFLDIHVDGDARVQLWVHADENLADIDPSPEQPTHWRPKPLPPSDLVKTERTIDGAQVGAMFPEPNETASVVSHNSENLEDKPGCLSPGEAKETGNE